MIPTMMLLKIALSLTPITSTQVTSATMATAGRLTMIGCPNRWGAPAAISGVFSPVRRSVTSQPGMVKPNACFRMSLKYPDQEIATAILPTAYSMIRSQPMIQAIISPRVA